MGRRSRGAPLGHELGALPVSDGSPVPLLKDLGAVGLRQLLKVSRDGGMGKIRFFLRWPACPLRLVADHPSYYIPFADVRVTTV